MLLKTVERSPNPTVAAATAYLGHGEGQHPWPSFLQILETQARSLREDGSAINAALLAFDLFEHAARRMLRAKAFA